MSTFKRKKIINGQEYVYEVTSTYDPVTKKVKQKNKYLGKEVDGKIVKIRQKNPKAVLSYGEFLPVSSLVEHYGILEVLTKKISREEALSLVVIAYARLLKGISACHVKSWYESTVLYKEYGKLPLSSQQISKLFKRVSHLRLQDDLSSHLVSMVSSKRSYYYDITSISSFSRQIDLLEWGHNRDGLELPQVNMSVVLDKEENIPVMYEVYPGSISDVTTIANTLKRLKILGVKEFSLVLDRGFFSQENIELLIRSRVDYVIPVPSYCKNLEDQFFEIKRKIESPKFGKIFGKEVLFTVPGKVKVKDLEMTGHWYYTPSRAQQERDNFYRKLLEKQQLLQEINPSKIKDLPQRVQHVANHYNRYFECKVVKGKMLVKILNREVEKRLRRAGLFFLACSGDNDWQCALENYRSKQHVENGFNQLKNDLDLQTPDVHSSETLSTTILVAFIALLLKMKMKALLLSSKVTEKLSFMQVLIELSKIKKIDYGNNEFLTTEITKTQREILKALKVVPKEGGD